MPRNYIIPTHLPNSNNFQPLGLKWQIIDRAIIQIINAIPSIRHPTKLLKIAKLTKLNNIFPILNRYEEDDT
jgi:hypothetical protein